MKINTENLISISEVNQNFSRASKLVEERDVAIILKNNQPKYVLIKFDAVARVASLDEEIGDAVRRAAAGIGSLELLYCPKCLALEGLAVSGCPHCGARLRRPLPDDPVFLRTASYAEVLLISPVLTGGGIPFALKGDAASGGLLGSQNTIAQYEYYVPYSAFWEAKELLEGVFGGGEQSDVSE